MKRIIVLLVPLALCRAYFLSVFRAADKVIKMDLMRTAPETKDKLRARSSSCGALPNRRRSGKLPSGSVQTPLPLLPDRSCPLTAG